LCLAIYKPPGKDVAEANLKGGWQANPHGAGFAYVRNGKVEIEKEFMKLQDFLTAYEAAVKKNKKSPFLIHFRITSMGHSGPGNTHPFQIQNGALIHNGTIYGTGATHGVGPSDTAKFAERYSTKLTFQSVEENKKELESALSPNKVAILFNDGSHQIINEATGYTIDGIWYSNNHFLHAAERFRSTP